MVASTLDPQLSTLDRGSDATFGCGGAALWLPPGDPPKDDPRRLPRFSRGSHSKPALRFTSAIAKSSNTLFATRCGPLSQERLTRAADGRVLSLRRPMYAPGR
jgi:hypothetical protein